MNTLDEILGRYCRAIKASPRDQGGQKETVNSATDDAKRQLSQHIKEIIGEQYTGTISAPISLSDVASMTRLTMANEQLGRARERGYI